MKVEKQLIWQQNNKNENRVVSDGTPGFFVKKQNS